MRQATQENRGAARVGRGEEPDLGQTLSRIPQEIASPMSTRFRVIVEGTAQPLRAAIRDEVHRIGRESLLNAFRHSRATKIEAQLHFDSGCFGMLIRDNGCGIDPQELAALRDRHFGLAGMREGAERIGAKLRVLSRVGSGTEVQLAVTEAY